MPAQIIGQTPSLATFLTSLKRNPSVDSSIALLISLLKRRQIKNSRPCAIATAHLLQRVIETEQSENATAENLIERVREVGRRLVSGQPRELAVGNVVRRILGFVREAAERMGSSEDGGDASASTTAIATATTTSYAGIGSQVAPPTLFSFLEHPLGPSPAGTPPPGTPKPQQHTPEKTDETLDLKAEVESAISDFLQELFDVDAQIAEYALDQIHAGETILTHTSSHTVQRFLAAAAKKRKFTVIHAEAYPNDHERTHATIVNGGSEDGGDGERWKPLTSMGITVILIPDTAVFALMSRINKVIISPHAVLANGALVAAAGASTIALAANTHRVPVVVLAGLYKLCPQYPFDAQELIEYGDPGKVVGFDEGEFMDKVDVVNPLFDFVGEGCTDLFVTNVGAVSPGYLYRFVGDHYWGEDVEI